MLRGYRFLACLYTLTAAAVTPPPVIVMPSTTSPPIALPSAPAARHGCLPGGDGYLRARLRGTENLDVDWHNAELECDGGPRPGGVGLRVSFAGPPHPDGRRLRMVFGMSRVREGRGGRELPTNVTIIFEGEQRFYSTRGDEHCTVDRLRQERIGALGGDKRTWRVVASGFCVSPANGVNSEGRILVMSFDFAGDAVFEDEPPADKPAKPKT
jgi:hypothetical protein